MSRDERLVLFFAGLGVGIAGALFLASDSGRHVRSRIRKRTGEAGNYLKERASGATDAMEEVFSKSKEAVSGAVSKGTVLMSDLKDHVDDAVGAAKKVVDDVLDKSREFAHEAGKTVEKSGKLLQNV